MVVLAAFTLLLAAVSRVAIARAAASSARVDHFYWRLAADAYRSQRGLPVSIRGKYLLEDDAQSYPPLFGILLGRWGFDQWEMAAVWLFEAAAVIVLVLLLRAMSAPPAAVALTIAVCLAAPVRATYNTQLNSRALGDFFLCGAIAAEAGAVFASGSDAARLVLWIAAFACTMLVMASHKMSLQLYLVLLLPWCWVTRSLLPMAVMVAAAFGYSLVVGGRFARYQLQTHWEYIAFWNRYWPWLGAHQFLDSPVYGDGTWQRRTAFHQPGIRGALRHLRLVLSYAPFNLMLPVASLVSGAWPPAWVIVWLGVAYLWAITTLIIRPLRCLGGGHLYVFNAVAPGACYVAWLPDTPPVIAVLAIGVLLTGVALFMAWRIVQARPIVQDEMFQQALTALAALPPSRVAVFPTQNAEAVAYRTNHAVLWGGHGHGLSRFEGFFPVLTKPLATFLDRYEVRWILWDDRYWTRGAEQLRREGAAVADQMSFGHWRLTPCVARGVAAAGGHA